MPDREECQREQDDASEISLTAQATVSLEICRLQVRFPCKALTKMKLASFLAQQVSVGDQFILRARSYLGLHKVGAGWVGPPVRMGLVQEKVIPPLKLMHRY